MISISYFQDSFPQRSDAGFSTTQVRRSVSDCAIVGSTRSVCRLSECGDGCRSEVRVRADSEAVWTLQEGPSVEEDGGERSRHVFKRPSGPMAIP